MAALRLLAFILYLFLGIFQLAATYSGLETWLGWPWIIAGPIAFLLSYIPLVGTILGMFGAVEAWEWSWVQAGALFFGPFVVVFICAIVSGGFEAIADRR